MFLFLHGLALALGFLMGFGGGSGFSHVSGGGMISAPMDSGGGMPPVVPGDSGGGMPPATGTAQGGG